MCGSNNKNKGDCHQCRMKKCLCWKRYAL